MANGPVNPFSAVIEHSMYSKNQNKIIDLVVESIIRQQQENGGKIPPRLVREMLDCLNEQGIRVSRDVLNGRIRRRRAKPGSKCPSAIAASAVCESSTAGDPAHSTGNSNTKMDNVQCNNPRVLEDQNMFEDTEVMNDGKTSKPRGRPKGSTKKAREELIEKRKRLIDEVAIEYAGKLEEKQHTMRSRLPKGYLKQLVEDKRQEFGIKGDMKISLGTIRGRAIAKSLTPKHPGTPSPLQELEAIVVPIIIERARIHQPMRPPEVIDLVNRLIEGTVHQERLIAWKRVHQPHQSGAELGKVGSGYFQKFMKRHRNYLDLTKKSSKESKTMSTKGSEKSDINDVDSDDDGLIPEFPSVAARPRDSVETQQC